MNDTLPTVQANGPAKALPASEAPSLSVAKIHGAKQIPEQYFWVGHGVGIVLMLVAVLCIVFAKGPRRADAASRLVSVNKG